MPTGWLAWACPEACPPNAPAPSVSAPHNGRPSHSPSAPTCDKVRSPIRCQAWTAATPSTSKYVKTPMYLMLRRPTGKSERGTAQGGRRRCRGPRDQTHPTAQAQATPVSVSQNHQLREKDLGQSGEAKLGTALRASQEAMFLRHLLGSGLSPKT